VAFRIALVPAVGIGRCSSYTFHDRGRANLGLLNARVLNDCSFYDSTDFPFQWQARGLRRHRKPCRHIGGIILCHFSMQDDITLSEEEQNQESMGQGASVVK
jgi:hypothetical protein